MAHGKFVWYELMTTDTKAAEAFYRNVIGWNAQDSGMPGMSYTIWSAGEAPIGGLMEVPKEARDAGARPGWIGYVEVDNVDASAAKAKQDGGTIHRAADDIPGVGRFAVIADPRRCGALPVQGNVRTANAAAGAGTPGTVGWHELYAADLDAAFAFYAKLFGWTKAEHHDMGPDGHLPDVRHRRRDHRRHDDQATCGAAPRAGCITSMWTPSMPRHRACRPAAERSSTARWRCRADIGSCNAATHKARRSASSRRAVDLWRLPQFASVGRVELLRNPSLRGVIPMGIAPLDPSCGLISECFRGKTRPSSGRRSCRMTIATELAGRIRAFTYDGLPNAAVEWAKMGILDTVGVTLAGSREPCARIALRVSAARRPGPGVRPGAATGGDQRGAGERHRRPCARLRRLQQYARRPSLGADPAGAVRARRTRCR